MSIQQDRLTFFGVLIGVIIVVVGYLQVGQLYPITGRSGTGVQGTDNVVTDHEALKEEDEALPSEGATP